MSAISLVMGDGTIGDGTIGDEGGTITSGSSDDPPRIAAALRMRCSRLFSGKADATPVDGMHLADEAVMSSSNDSIDVNLMSCRVEDF